MSAVTGKTRDEALQRDSSGQVVLSVGPQDVDSAAGVTKDLGVHNHAHRLLQRHARMYPPALRTLLSRPADGDRSAFLVERPELIAAVVDAAESVTGRKAFLPEGAEVESVSVKGDNATGRVFALLFRVESGRSARGAINYDSVPAVERAYQEHLAAAEVTPYNETSPSAAPDGEPDAAAADAEARLQALEKQLQDLAAENASLKEQADQLAEPFEGYEDMTADDAAKRITEGGYLEFGRAGLERIRDYEDAQDRPRVTIGRAVEAQLEALDAAEAAADAPDGE